MLPNYLISLLDFIFTETGMEASEDMSTSFLDLRVLCHHMMLLISIQIVMQMRTRSCFILFQIHG